MGIGRTQSYDTSRQPNNTTMKVAATILVFALCAQYASAEGADDATDDKIAPKDEEVTGPAVLPVLDSCKTKKGKQCVFPFKYKKVLYTSCTNRGTGLFGTGLWGFSWCATEADQDGNYKKGEWDKCDKCSNADDNRSEKASERRTGQGNSAKNACFPGSSLVKLSSGETRPMRDVKTGDSVMTMVEGRMTTTKVLGFVAKSVSSSTKYLNIRTEDGRSLSISQTHVMFVSDPYGNSKDVMAKDVNIGDRVMVQDGDHVKKSVVVEIGLEAMVGAYVPLTEHGTLMVDDVLCSCYTNCDHPTVHLLFSPARWFPSLFLTDTEGGTIHSRLGPHVGYYLHKIGMLNYFHSNTLQRARAETQDVEKTMDAETSVCMAPALVHDVCPSFNFMKQ